MLKLKKLLILGSISLVFVACGGGDEASKTLQSILTSHDKWYMLDKKDKTSVIFHFTDKNIYMVEYDDLDFAKKIQEENGTIKFIENGNSFRDLNDTVECSLGYYETGINCIELACVGLEDNDEEGEERASLFYNKEEAIKSNGECLR